MEAQGIRKVLTEYLKEHPHIKQKDIAEYSGISAPFISMLLNGVNNKTGMPIEEISSENVRKLSVALGISYEELVSKAECNKPFRRVPIISNVVFDSDIKALMNSATYYEMVSSKILNDRPAIAYEITDSSQYPDLVINDIVIISIGQELTHNNNGCIFLLALSTGTSQFVRLYRQIDDGIIVHFCSGHEPCYYSKSNLNDIRIVGQVVAIHRQL